MVHGAPHSRSHAGHHDSGPLGGPGKYVEADTTYIGGKEKNKHRPASARLSKIGGMGKQIVLRLVERGGTCPLASHCQCQRQDPSSRSCLTQVDRKSTSDDRLPLAATIHVGKQFARHEMVDHGKDEYVRGDAYSNTVESYFCILKRGIIGVYHHVSEAASEALSCRVRFGPRALNLLGRTILANKGAYRRMRGDTTMVLDPSN